jgi:hypothetical protein
MTVSEWATTSRRTWTTMSCTISVTHNPTKHKRVPENLNDSRSPRRMCSDFESFKHRKIRNRRARSWEVWFLVIFTFATIQAMTEFQIGLTLLNLKLFLLSQIMLIILMMAAIITNFHWGLHLLLQISKMAENEVKFKFSWIIEPNQFHKYKAKGHCRKRWWEVSALIRGTSCKLKASYTISKTSSHLLAVYCGEVSKAKVTLKEKWQSSKWV